MNPSNSAQVRRLAAGVGMIGFAVTGLISSILGSSEGTDTPPSELYRIMVDSDTMVASALAFMLSAALTIPAMAGMMHLTRGRGAALAHAGGALLTLGALGHMGYATWQIMLARLPQDPDQAALVAYLERASVVSGVLLPLLLALPFGILLMVVGLRRAGRVAAWVMWLTVAVIAADVLVNSIGLHGKVVPLTVWSLAVIASTPVAIAMLRTPLDEWTGGDGGLPARA